MEGKKETKLFVYKYLTNMFYKHVKKKYFKARNRIILFRERRDF